MTEPSWYELEARVKRLEFERTKDIADVDRFRGMARTYMDERDEARAELERLNAELRLTKDFLTAAVDEIEELRGELLAVRRVAETESAAANDLADRAWVENESLRAELESARKVVEAAEKLHATGYTLPELGDALAAHRETWPAKEGTT